MRLHGCTTDTMIMDFVRGTVSNEQINHLDKYSAECCEEECEACKRRFIEIMYGILSEAVRNCSKQVQSYRMKDCIVSRYCKYRDVGEPSRRPYIPDVMDRLAGNVLCADDIDKDDGRDEFVMDMASPAGLDPLLRQFDDRAQRPSCTEEPHSETRPHIKNNSYGWPVVMDVTRSDPMYLNRYTENEDKSSSGRSDQLNLTYNNSASSGETKKNEIEVDADEAIQTNVRGFQQNTNRCRKPQSYPYHIRRSSSNETMNGSNEPVNHRKVAINEETEIFFPPTNDLSASPRQPDNLYRSLDWDRFEDVFADHTRQPFVPVPHVNDSISDFNSKILGYGGMISSSLSNIKRQPIHDSELNYKSMNMYQDYSGVSYSYLMNQTDYSSNAAYLVHNKLVSASKTIDNVCIDAMNVEQVPKENRITTRSSIIQSGIGANQGLDSKALVGADITDSNSLQNPNHYVIEQLNSVILDVIDGKTTKLEAKKVFHNCGTCKPCAFFHHPRKLCNDIRKCYFCHENDHKNSYLLMRAWKRRRQTIVQILPPKHASILTDINEDTSLVVGKDEEFYRNAEFTMAVRSLRLFLTNSIPRSIKPMHANFLRKEVINAVIDGTMDVADVKQEHMINPK